MPAEKLLLIFIKNPEKGRVKTRLAERIGKEKALEVYHRLLSITKKETLPLDCNRQVWYSRYVDKDDIWENGEYEKRLQKGQNLGERMQEAFRQAFVDGYEKVAVIGSDCAELTREIIQQAFSKLEDSDVVIGPSEDGGYYLLGMKSFYPDLFADIEWSTGSVFTQTVKRVENLGLSMRVLPMLNDIDTEEDLDQSAVNIEYP